MVSAGLCAPPPFLLTLLLVLFLLLLPFPGECRSAGSGRGGGVGCRQSAAHIYKLRAKKARSLHCESRGNETKKTNKQAAWIIYASQLRGSAGRERRTSARRASLPVINSLEGSPRHTKKKTQGKLRESRKGGIISNFNTNSTWAGAEVENMFFLNYVEDFFPDTFYFSFVAKTDR